MDTTIRLPDSKLGEAVSAKLQEWENQGISGRIWEKDHTVWSPDPTEVSNRLGWLDLPEESLELLDELQEFAAEIHHAELRHVVLLGMGGSSLAPEVFAETFGDSDEYPELIVLDSTHPQAVRVVDSAIDPLATLFVVSSKSGTTLETLSFFRFFWDRVASVNSTPGEHFVAITDPGSSLDDLASERRFRRVFHAPPTVGGRNSALCLFGLVPAALVGADVAGLLESAGAMAIASSASVPAAQNPSLQLGVTLGVLAEVGIDKLIFECSPSIASFPAWIEQLVAESIGKEGKGIVPVDGETLLDPDSYSRDRVFVGISLAGDGDETIGARLDALSVAGHPVVHKVLESRNDLGAEMFLWELATAAAGAVLGINPFDQPDVQLAKSLAKEAMESKGDADGETSEIQVEKTDTNGLTDALAEWASVSPGDYLALQAYLAPSTENESKLQTIRSVLGERLTVASTLGFGPRFLHSTGQLHKGGTNNGLFLQFVDEPKQDLPVPETDFTFGELLAAQALGDFRALKQRGRRVLRINLGADAGLGLDMVREALG